jgi:hypothetical protein
MFSDPARQVRDYLIIFFNKFFFSLNIFYFDNILLRFEIDDILDFSPVLGGSIYLLFNLIMLMVMLNLIITTISETFSGIKGSV